MGPARHARPVAHGAPRTEELEVLVNPGDGAHGLPGPQHGWQSPAHRDHAQAHASHPRGLRRRRIRVRADSPLLSDHPHRAIGPVSIDESRGARPHPGEDLPPTEVPRAATPLRSCPEQAAARASGSAGASGPAGEAGTRSRGRGLVGEDRLPLLLGDPQSTAARPAPRARPRRQPGPRASRRSRQTAGRPASRRSSSTAADVC
jgi:hypothetical protein